MPIEPITNSRLYRKVADQIALLIQSGVYQPGQKLPGERNLIAHLGVSRASLREALISLEAEGLIEIRDRAGIFVLSHDKEITTATQETDVLELFFARELVEVEIAALAARHAKAEHIDTLMSLLGKMVNCSVSDLQYVDYDRQFHQTLAQACGNRVLHRTVSLLWESTEQIIDKSSAMLTKSESTWQAVVMEHRDIFHAIRDKDPHSARIAMHLHLKNAIDRIKIRLH
ncbi:MAG: FadR/GntR family transcriptional regulator [Formivibrio sp.]|nr:FadR/GntR family transcriptional regulator [Formivibrio sp.]